jgi:superfamily II DNA or RNA helicase
MEQTLYVSHNLSRIKETKFGIFYNKRYSRILDSKEQFSHISKYIYLYDLQPTNKYKLNIKNLDDIISHLGRDLKLLEKVEKTYKIKLPILREISLYLLNNDGGIELIQSSKNELIDKFIINELILLGINVKKYTNEEVKQINDKVSKEYYNKKNKKYNLDNLIKFNKIYSNREYQNIIINNSLDILNVDKKLYLELATGAGKTFITFKIINELKPDIIICFSPRTKINKQNLDRKYLHMIGNNYLPINLSTDEIKIDNIKNKKIIITSCIQSYNKLYNIIKNLDINNKKIFIWFDEAHWGIEESWLVNNNNNIIDFFLNNKLINYRFFTSASPDHNIVKNNNNIFGELYQLIKVKELIKQKWLCNINPYIFENQINNNINLINYVLNTFNKLNKNWGLSFHNKAKHAYKMFCLHFEKFLKNETNIKPFLIIGDNKYYKENQINYKYNNLNSFEDTKNSIAYVVKKVDMGYDFNKLDFIVFCDPKVSSKDIIQCIGRGCRPDYLGENGKNRDKKLVVLLPIFIHELDEENNFTKIINVIRYLIEDIGLDIEDCIINKNQKESKLNRNIGEIKYNGNQEISAKLLDLLGFKINTKKITEILIKNNITNEKDYKEYVNKNKHLKLNENVYSYNGFKWKPIIDPNNNKYYSTFDECNNAFQKIIINKEFKFKLKKYGMKFLNNCDSKIPPFNKLSEYYYS